MVCEVQQGDGLFKYNKEVACLILADAGGSVCDSDSLWTQ